MVEISNFSVSFGGTPVLTDISCFFPSGTITGIVGRNGSGKTVLLKAICGLLGSYTGTVTVYRKQLTSTNAHQFSIGALIETPGFLREYSGYRNLYFLATLTPGDAKAKVTRAMELVGLDPDLKKRVGVYSLGMRQRLGLAQALLDDPDVLVLDEPMNGLDSSGSEAIRQLLRQLRDKGRTIILATHCEEDINGLCDVVYSIKDGKLQR